MRVELRALVLGLALIVWAAIALAVARIVAALVEEWAAR